MDADAISPDPLPTPPKEPAAHEPNVFADLLTPDHPAPPDAAPLPSPKRNPFATGVGEWRLVRRGLGWVLAGTLFLAGAAALSGFTLLAGFALPIAPGYAYDGNWGTEWEYKWGFRHHPAGLDEFRNRDWNSWCSDAASVGIEATGLAGFVGLALGVLGRWLCLRVPARSGARGLALASLLATAAALPLWGALGCAYYFTSVGPGVPPYLHLGLVPLGACLLAGEVFFGVFVRQAGRFLESGPIRRAQTRFLVGWCVLLLVAFCLAVVGSVVLAGEWKPYPPPRTGPGARPADEIPQFVPLDNGRRVTRAEGTWPFRSFLGAVSLTTAGLACAALLQNAALTGAAGSALGELFRPAPLPKAAPARPGAGKSTLPGPWQEVSAGLRLVRLGVVICLAGEVLVVLLLFTAGDRRVHAREARDAADTLAVVEPVALFLAWSVALRGRLCCVRVRDPLPAQGLALASVAATLLSGACLLNLPTWGPAALFGYPLAGLAGEGLFLWYLHRLGRSLGSKPLVRAATATLVVGGVLTGAGLLAAVVFRASWPPALFPPLLGEGGYLLWSGLLLFPYLYLVGPARQAIIDRFAAAAPVPTPDPGPT